MLNDGFKNERKLIKALHNKYFSTLNPNLQRMIRQSFKNYNGVIRCHLEAGNNKSDIKIEIGNESHSYSIKMGKGNSIHQEPLEKFLSFLTQKHHLPLIIKSYIQEFIWADGSTDGRGEITNRISARQFKKRNPHKIKAIQTYLDTIKTSLIKRFLIEGVNANASAEYLYYGSVKNGIVCKSDDILNWLTKQNSRAVLSIGKLSFQAWNRNLKGKKRLEKKRGVIQIKWGGLKRDMQKIAKLNLGQLQEIDFVKVLNKKEHLSYWKTLGLNPSNHYALRVTSQKRSLLTKQKIWAKADAFIVKGAIPMAYLKLNDYFLDEKHLKTFKLTPVKGTGISIKQAYSNAYQILKIAPSTFKKLFGSNILAAGSSIYYKKKKKLSLNPKILEGWGVSQEEFFSYYAKVLALPINSVTHGNCQKCLKKIKRYAKKKLIKIIRENSSLSAFIFFGKGNFKEPFTAPWLFEHGAFKKNHQVPFTVTTGSGRSKGKYSLVIKAK